MKNPKFIVAASPLLLILLIDGMGLGLVFPILNDLIIDPHHQFISAAMPENFRHLIFGITIGIFMLCWFLGAPFLGDLSDQIGRKKSLMICLVGSCLGYLISGVGVTCKSFTLLILGRIIAGFTSGSQPIAQASIIDISDPNYKTRNLGLVMLALSLGFIFGPLFGGLLSDQRILPWFNLALPFYFAAVISLLNAFLLQLFFHETFLMKEKIILKWHRAITIFVSAFRHERVRGLSLIFLMLVFGWSSYYSFISMFLLKQFNFSTLQITLFMAVMGVGFGMGNGFLANFLASRFEHKRIVIVTTAASSVMILITLLGDKPIYSWFLIIPIAAILSSAYSILLTIFSNQVDEKSQGWVMGITGAILALIFGLNAIVLGFLSNLNINFPMIVSVVGLALTAFMMIFYQEKPRIHSQSISPDLSR